MRCKTCDYPLWTIRSRVCPECGSPFAPSDFEFTLNSVRFCCPHCDQQYFGTGFDGHLEPRSFDCVKCHTRVDMDEMVLVPRQGIEERRTEVRRLPWTDKKRGFFSRFFAMVGWGMGRPGDIGRALPWNLSTLSAIWFALLVDVLGVIFGIGTIVLIVFFLASSVGGGGVGGPGMGGFMTVDVLRWAVGLVVGWLVGLTLWALLTHWFIGGIGRQGVTIGRTMQVICLTSGPMLLTATPCLGIYGLQYAAMVWWIISAAIGLRALHGCSGVRAAFATMIPPLLPVVAVIGVIVVSVMGVFGTASAFSSGGMSAAWSSVDQYQASTLATAISSEVMLHNGAYPTHGVEMLGHGTATGAELFSSANYQGLTTARVGGQRLTTFSYNPGAVRSAVAALPADVIAHRVGDVVFTWHGFAPGTDPGLWVAVLAPPTGSNADRAGMSWWAIQADGSVVEIITAARTAQLTAQNQLRKALGLAPLPPLVSITDSNPATP